MAEQLTEGCRLRFTLRVAAFVLLVFTPLVGCYTPRWIVQHSITPERVAQALDDPGGVSRDLNPKDVPLLPAPTYKQGWDRFRFRSSVWATSSISITSDRIGMTRARWRRRDFRWKTLSLGKTTVLFRFCRKYS